MSGQQTPALSPDRQDLKVASRALVRSYGGQEAAAALLPRRHQHYSNCGNPHTEDFLTIDEVAQLEDRTAGLPGYPAVTRALAKRQGFILIPMPQASEGGAVEALVMELASEFGDVAQAVRDALVDREWTKAEKAEALHQLEEMTAVSARLRCAIESVEVSK
tara:strand:+ start:255 stop:740 length:486 start_codon:yes stop_codon:yes gene_type:complete